VILIVDKFIEQIERDFDGFQKKYNITWKDDKVRQKAIDIISGADKKREDYRMFFRILVRDNISKKNAHFLAKETNDGWKGVPVGTKDIMNVCFKVKTKGKTEYFEINDIKICDYHIDRKLLIPDVYY